MQFKGTEPRDRMRLPDGFKFEIEEGESDRARLGFEVAGNSAAMSEMYGPVDAKKARLTVAGNIVLIGVLEGVADSDAKTETLAAAQETIRTGLEALSQYHEVVKSQAEAHRRVVRAEV